VGAGTRSLVGFPLMPHTREQNTAYRRARYHDDPVFQVKHREAANATKGLPARGYLPVTLDDHVPALETRIERVPADSGTAKWFDKWKQLRRDGWNVTVLVSADRRSLVGLACRNGERWRYC